MRTGGRVECALWSEFGSGRFRQGEFGIGIIGQHESEWRKSLQKGRTRRSEAGEGETSEDGKGEVGSEAESEGRSFS